MNRICSSGFTPLPAQFSHRARTARICGTLTFLFFLFAGPARATIQYQLSLANPSEHLFHVTMTVPDVHGELLLQMPAWNALYQVRDFSSRVEQLTAQSQAGQPLPMEKLDKLTWRTHADGGVTIRYAIFWDSPGPFASQLNEDHAFINPAMVFLYIPGRRAEDIFLMPIDLPQKWVIATPLVHAMDFSGSIRSEYITAPNYDAFADGPIEAGTFSFFQLKDLPNISVAIHGDNWKQSEVESALHKLCSYELQLMGGAPFEHYLFILHIGKGAAGAGGGMEHANSTAINVVSGTQLAGVAAHEFFHLWNVKRIRPASLEPVDYTKEQYTRALWFAEGVTSTYGNYTLVRSGLWSKRDFYDDLAEQITELESRPASHWQSAEQSSLDAWLEKYAYYNGPDFSVSYYTKGQVLGVLLDILIRDHTQDQHSLDDVLRKMNEDFARKGKWYRDSLDVRLTAEAIAGGSFEDFFQRYVAAAEPLPYSEILGKSGLLLQKQDVVRADPGFTFERDANAKPLVKTVGSGSTAERAGLHIGDELQSWNGDSVPRRIEGWLRNRKPGDSLRLQVRRGEQTVELTFLLGGATESIFVIDEDPNASSLAKAVREGLLHGATQPAAAAAH